MPRDDVTAIHREGLDHVLEARSMLPLPLDQVFPFFAAATNLEALTPPWLRFSIVTPAPIDIRRGSLIDYRLRLHGVPLRWRTEIVEWEPPHLFVDRQVRGPYHTWLHEHRFLEVAGGVVVADRVRYRIRGGRLVHRAANATTAARDLRAIFAYRQERLQALLLTGEPLIPLR
jgi:ligand-binding SRPBCC domain-containing protein